MTKEELELLLTNTSLRPAPDERAILFAMLTVAVIFTILGIVGGWLIGWTMCLMAHKEFRSEAKK